MKLHLPLFLRRTILTLMLAYGVPVLHAAALTLGAGDSLSVDYSVSDSLLDLNNGSLRLSGGTTLQLSSCGEGDGKTYTLLTGVSELLDAQGNVISLDSTNNAASRYFDTTQPGSGFWAGATLQLTDAGTLQLVLHNETVKEAITITSRKTYLQYYAGIAFENISNVSSSDAYGGATYGSTITLCDNGSVSFSGNTASSSSSDSYAYGGAIYGDDDSTITLSNNGSVSFSENTASSSSFYSYYSACGGAIYGGTITLSDNGSVVFEGNTASSSLYSSTSGGAIYGIKDITLSDNGSVVFEGNTASSSDSSGLFGGAIYGDTFSTITLRNNGSVVFEGNTASCGGAIGGRSFSTITLSNNGSVSFSENTASSSSSSASGGAIYGGTITLSDNGSVVFEGNTASSSCGGAIDGDEDITLSDNGSVVFEGNTASSGGAIYGVKDITLSDNGSVVFEGNTASSSDSSAYGGAIDASGDLSIRNNDSVEFYQNAEVDDGSYRLRSIYAYGGNGDEISLSAAAGKSITFYDSVYIGSGATVNLNQDYTYQAEDGSSVTIKQQGDIIFTGKYTEQHLNELLDAAGAGRTATASEIQHSRTTEVNAMTNLNGGRLRVEDGAVYKGYGITAHEGSAATVRLKDASLAHGSCDLTFNAGTTLELVGNNTISGNVLMKEGSTLSLDGRGTKGMSTLAGALSFAGEAALSLNNWSGWSGQNAILLFVDGYLSGWDDCYFGENNTADIRWVNGDLLVLNYNEETINLHFRGDIAFTSRNASSHNLKYYNSVSFENISTASYNGGAIYGDSSSIITLSDNGSVVFEGNTAISDSSYGSGGAIYGSTITLSDNGSVEFSGNTASDSSYARGGAIYGSTITLSDNGSVEFSGNTASGSPNAEGGAINGSVTMTGNGDIAFSGNTASSDSYYAEGGAIYGSTITLSDNESVTFSRNTASSSDYYAYGGAIYGSVTMEGNGDVSFSGNTASSSSSSSYASGGAIHDGFNGPITLSNNESVTFSGNTASASYRAYGGAIYGGPITLSNNGSVIFSGNTASGSSSASGGAIYTYKYKNLSIRNNESVEFYQNAEANDGVYRLRSIYADGYGDVSLSAAAGKSITFRDSIYIDSGSSFKLNEQYEGKAQQGDIIFTGATTVNDLYKAKGDVDGTAEEISNSRTTEVKTLTELYGGRLRIEAGAIYKGSGMTIVENSGASVWLRNAQMLHQGHNISFGKGTTFGLRGCNVSQSDNLFLEAGSSLSFDIAADNISTVVLTHTGALTLGGRVTLNIGTADSNLAHGQYKLLQVTDLSSLENWSNENLKMGEGSYTISDIEWVDNTLCFNYSGQKLSDLPILPEIPESEIPDTPVTPDEPEIPDTPVTPDEPEIPDTPVTPEEPEIPDTPVNPDEPEIPDTPVTPDEPEIPDTPVNPDEPEIPDTPVNPDEPEIPDTPVTPEEPEIPDTPVTPDEPEKSEPLNPLRPGAKPVLVGGDIDKNTEVILTEKGNVTLEGKVNAGAITVNSDKNITFKSNKKKPGSLTGDGDLTKKGKGTLTLNDGNSSWTGDTYLLAGTIKVKGSTALGRGDVYVQGGVLNLGSKAIANDIVQSANAAIKSGKKFTGTYTLEKGELQKGSTLNISHKATLEGGTVNGTLTGNGKTTVTGDVKLGDKGKITTKALTLDEDATLTTSAKGLSSKATTLTIGENALFSLGGKMTVDSLKLNGGELKTTAAKPAAMTVKNNMELTDATLTTNGKVTTNKLTLNESTMTIKGAKAQNLTVKQGLTLGSGSSLRLNGKLSAGSLTIKSGGTLTMSGSKPVTLKVKGALTLNSGSSIIMDYDFVQGKTYKVLTFGSYSGSKDYYSIFGVDADDCTITNTGKALTLTVTGKWNPQTQQKAVAAETPVVSVTAAKNNPVADALVQSNWGQLEASRAFVNAMANRSMAVQLGNGERAVWASAIGASSRHSSAGGHAGADTNVSGGAFGLETQVGRASLFGMALGNSWTRVSAHSFGTIEQDTTHLGLYGQTNWRSGVTAAWSAAYGRSESESMGSDWSQKQLQLDGRVSYNHELNANTVLSPFAGVQYYASDSAAIGTTDTGSLQNLRAEIGVTASHRVGKFGVYGEIALHQDMARNNPSVSMEGMRYTGMNPGRTGINFTIGASYELNDKWSVNASYTGEFVEKANAHSANVGASYKF